MDLVRAVVDGDEAAVAAALAEGADPNQWVNADERLIEHAAWQGRTGIVRALLAAGADPGEALLNAASRGHLDIAEALLAAGADVDCGVQDLSTPLLFACENGHLEMVRRLLAAGASLDTLDALDERPALLHAVAADRADIVQELLAAGASLEQTDARHGLTALLAACAWGRFSLAALLLEAGADATARCGSGDGALELGHRRGIPADLRKRLLAAGAQPRILIDEDFRRRFLRPRTPATLLLADAQALAALDADVDALLDWFTRHPLQWAGKPAPGASQEALEAAEAELGGWRWPAELAQLLRRVDGGLYLGEYTLLSAQGIARTWQGMLRLFRKGTFDSFIPHQETAGRVHFVWWHPGLLPLFEDGCGNQFCLDLDPGPAGQPGQILCWEVHGGPALHPARSLGELLRTYRQRLLALPDGASFENSSAYELLRPVRDA